MIRLLVVDDSALMRKVLGAIFAAEGDFDLAFARDGLEALDLLPRFAPDVVTLDVTMPGLDGLACLDRIMLERPCPVVMLSSLTGEGAEASLEALARGAVDVLEKPAGAVSLEIDRFAPVLVQTVRAAARARPRTALGLTARLRTRHADLAPRPVPAARPAPHRTNPDPAPDLPADPAGGLVLVGASTGGPPALTALLSELTADFPWPIVVAQHMPSTFTGPLARRLDGICALAVQEVTVPVPLVPGRVYVGRGDADVIVVRRPGGLMAAPAPAKADYPWHPSVDRLVESALGLVPPRQLVGVLMTGMGRDGARTMAALRARGGRTIAEAEATAVVWGMPGELVRAGGASVIAPLEAIAAELTALVA
ncbi:chemotaxis-specific protein-glutamate methyltransferase CheB [Methylobacterium frigidaeris]|uniref:Protein-glutamate methylesterase/protein-glutamine glutaminase n=1 Tax=Methylobacterium frigidaeris TaxID=2038277 RepID=A0AA37HC63_9HYPH|nr:chemotaxis-specific protein-glutamate methyltransferase CheB [Methylobacterium frigidaeris]PIK70243.1 chemotaxis response regulator protein-glutamate methylesterase [Methylobacterium frigidaeris]GJD62535.1 Protein-glutamate methylesterase/protein-glutamine glutaminase [Methylobacterium frigidaeris]